MPPADLPPGVQIAYLYARRVDGSYLSEEIARGIPGRTVTTAPLDVLLYQNGWASVFVQRNRVLFPLSDLATISTNVEFLFQAPEVRFASPVVSKLTYQSFSLDTMSGATGDLDARLTRFFAGLYNEGNGATSDEVAMQGLYSYELVAGAPAIPRVRLPINLLPPTASVVDPAVKPDFVAPFAKMIDARLSAADNHRQCPDQNRAQGLWRDDGGEAAADSGPGADPRGFGGRLTRTA